MNDLAASVEAVDVAALIVEVFAVRPLAAHGPQRDRPVGTGEDVFLVFPAHVGDLLEAVGQRLADRRLALQSAADRLGAARQAEGAVLGEAIDDAIDIAAGERRRDLSHPFDRDHCVTPLLSRPSWPDLVWPSTRRPRGPSGHAR